VSEQTNREKEIFWNALNRAPGEERQRYVEVACGNDAVLLARIQALLRANDVGEGFLPKQPRGGPPVDVGLISFLTAQLSEKTGDAIGRYKLLEKIGEGGCGVVYMAQQEEPVRRKVALKIIKLGMDTKQVVARFEAERQALALMDHTNIAKVLDAGATEAGRPFFVMELVSGVKITDYCDQNHLTTRQRLDLFIQVCRAIQHAHQKGIIHRDIKPSNVLVATQDGVPIPKVIDFGVAKALGQELTEMTLFTLCEQMIGTPAYMSPEQAGLGGLDIDTRSDIYSLGGLLYELLTGVTPLDAGALRKRALDEVRRLIRETDPLKPSTRLLALGGRLAEMAKNRRTDPAALRRLIWGDLDWITMKALEKDRRRRYETANDLAIDIERHLRDQPVVARPPSAAYWFQKLVRRHKAVFAAGSAVGAALILGLAGSVWMYFRERATRLREAEARGRATAAERVAQGQSQRAQAAANELKLALSNSDFSQAVRLIEQGNGIDALAYLSRSLAVNPANQASLTRLATLLTDRRWMLPMLLVKESGGVRNAQFSPDGKRIVTASDGGTARVWDAASGQPLTKPLTHGRWVRWAQFSPDGKRVVTASFDRTARVWDAQTGQPLTEPLSHSDAVVFAQFSPDGKRVATASDDGTARVWDAYTGQPLTEPLKHTKWVRSAQFSPNGKLIVTASDDSTARIWDVHTGQPFMQPLAHGSGVYWAEFSADGTRIVTASDDGTARVWSAETGRPLTEPLKHSRGVRSARFSPDGARIVTASDDGTARVWDAQSGQPVTQLLRHTGAVRSAQFSSDGKRIVTASFDGTARTWDSETGQPLTEPLKHNGWLWWAQFSPDGTRIVTASGDGTARVWGPETGRPMTEPLKHSDGVAWVQSSTDGKRIVTASDDGTARVWDAYTSRPLTRPLKHRGAVRSAQFSPDGTRIVTASDDATARVWDAATGLPLTEPLKHRRKLFRAEFDHQGARIVTASEDHTARIWDAQSGQPLTEPLQHDGGVLWATFSHDENRIVTASVDSSARVWDAHSGKLLIDPLRHNGWVFSAQFGPDGTRIVTASDDGTARVWDAQTGQPLGEPLNHSGLLFWAEFSPDGTRVATASADGSGRVWDARSGQLLIGPLRHGDSVRSARFSPDGKRVVTASVDGTARVWDAHSGQPLTEPLNHRGAVHLALFSPDGKRVLTASADGTAVAWDIAPAGAEAPGWLLRLAEALSGQVLNDQGILEPSKADPTETIRRARLELNQAPANDEWAELFRWFLADPLSRSISPYSKVSVRDYIENRLKEHTAESLALAERLAYGTDELLQRISAARRLLERTTQPSVPQPKRGPASFRSHQENQEMRELRTEAEQVLGKRNPNPQDRK